MRFLLIMFFGCCLLFAEAEMLIKQNLSVSAEVEATKYTSVVRISGSETLRTLKELNLENKNAMIKTYNAINESLGDESLGKNSICKGGSFSIEPVYEYKNNIKIQNGFESHYSLECAFNAEQNAEFQRILRVIEEEVGKNKYLLFTLPRIDKVIDDARVKDVQEQLNTKLLNIALQKAQEYSKLSRKKCSVKEIHLGNVEERVTPLLSSAVSFKSARDSSGLESVRLPTTKNPQESAQGSVIFSCR